MKPGATLAETKGSHRIRTLEKSRLNLWVTILADLDKISCIEHEIKTISTQMRTPDVVRKCQ